MSISVNTTRNKTNINKEFCHLNTIRPKAQRIIDILKK
jgi:hypothetical protein